ncbi:MAG: hypothetical protein KJ626_15370 [Verrucomicrobia bacterium]|nr:hypothetical protein [Verrucomicrobiota bacterium]
MRRLNIVCLFAVLSAFILTATACMGSKDPALDEIKDLTRAHIRVAWCQDRGEQGTDIYAERNELVLMGFDNKDDKGERVILADRGNYARPMITPDGKRVIFSNRKTGDIHIVNWDGTGLTELVDGFALDTFTDPATGIDWLYYASEPRPVQRQDVKAYEAVMRLQIDKPSVKELVWNKTMLSQLFENNFQVSGDGSRASLIAPDACSLAYLPNGDREKYGSGCWPSISPDMSYRYWRFDGGHRSLSMFDAGGKNERRIVINDAPNMDNLEVFHPRWSNHPRFMVMTGPLRIPGGGHGVEIYMGMFDRKFTKIDEWARITFNDKADFYPDLWVKPKQRWLAKIAAQISPPQPPPEARPETEVQPFSTDGLIFLWENKSAANELSDDGSGMTRICRVEPDGHAKYGRFFSMDVSGGSFTAEIDSSSLLRSLRESNALSIEMVFTPADGDTAPTGSLVSFSADDNSSDFALALRGGQLCFGTRGREEFPLGMLPRDRTSHLTLTYSAQGLATYLDGKPLQASADVYGNFDEWGGRHLVFGENLQGLIEGVALYNRAISPEEAAQHYRSFATRLAERTLPEQLVVSATLTEKSAMPTPESISPYRRAVLCNRYKIEKIERGSYDGDELIAAHWVILDSQVLDSSERELGRTYRMKLELFDDRPELEGERLITDMDEFSLPLYYDTGS